MKIIIFTENSRAGGMDSFIKTLVQSWPDKNDEFLLICNTSHPGLSQLELDLSDNVKVIRHEIPLNWNLLVNLPSSIPNILRKVLRRALRILLAPLQFIALRKLLKENRGDLLISVNGAYPGGETCRIVNIAWNSLGYGKSIHNIHNFAVPYRWFFAFYERPLDYFLSRSCDFFVGVSQVCSDSLRLRPTFKNNDNIVTIFNGLSPPNKLNKATIKFNDYLKVPTEEKVLLMLAGYEPRKGHRFLLNSMKHVFEFHPKIHLVICGDGSKKDRMEIEELVSRIVPNQNIHLLGYIPNAADLIKQAYVLLISSQEFESFGLTAVEAMQRSTPIVSTDVGGLPEVIGKNGVCGFCCPRDNPSIFAEKIIYLLENPNLAKKMGRNGLTRVKNLFRADIMAKKYSDLLRT